MKISVTIRQTARLFYIYSVQLVIRTEAGIPRFGHVLWMENEITIVKFNKNLPNCPNILLEHYTNIILFPIAYSGRGWYTMPIFGQVILKTNV